MGSFRRDPVWLPGHLLDLERGELLTRQGQPVELRRQALDVLLYLARHAGRVVPKDEILQHVWAGVVVTDDSPVQAVSDARRALGDAAHAVVQTVPRRGYRLNAVAPPATATASDGDERPHSTSTAVARGRQRLSARWWAGWAALTVLAVVGLLGWSAWRDSDRPPAAVASPAPDRPPIAVLAFHDRGGGPGAAIARGFAEDLITELARNADLKVIAAHSSFQAAGGDDPPPVLARRLGARFLVSGEVQRTGDQLRLVVRLVDGRDGSIVWTAPHAVSAHDVYAARDAIVGRIAATLHSTMRSSEERRAAQRPPASLDIYETTLRAIALKHRLTAADAREARALLERVVALDPAYAPGWLYLGFVNSLDTQHQLNGSFSTQRMEEAIGQLKRAIALEAHLPAAHLALSLSYSPLGRHQDALAAVEHCLALGPSDAECRMHYASLLVRVAGRPRDALPHAREALAANPLPPSYVVHQYGLVLWANGDLPGALKALDESVRRAPANVHARLTRIVALVEAGRIDEARAAVQAMRGGTAPAMSAAQAAALTFAPQAAALIDRRLRALRSAGWPDDEGGPATALR